MAKSSEQREDAFRSKMVGWYDPGQLAVTGLQTVLSSLFAQRADYRLIEALQPPPPPEDYLAQDELWIDYVSDVGDGWNPTYAVACALALAELSDGEGAPLPRGKVLIMGGDEVYPTPTANAYEERLVRPYTQALAPVGESYQPVLYAIPGNHDWYDGLGNFMNLFCQGNEIGAWKTKQKRSYFALQLAHRTWLFGVDIQLDSDIDNPQIDYFTNLDIQVGDRIILCTAEPDWIYGNIYEGKKNLSVLEGKLLQRGAKIVLQLAGDLHHYRRHTVVGAGDVHLVTAGGGGAFLHPTHTHDVDTVKVGTEKGLATYALNKETEYPSRALSRWMGLRNIPFFVYNPLFGIVPGAIYTVLSWVLPPSDPAGSTSLERLSSGVSLALHELAAHPSGLVWVVGVLLGFVVFTDTHKTFYKWLGGLTHGVAHLIGALVVSMVASH
ncbi:MAG: metallophosphoesterase, partial [Minicystis sp.]